MHYVENFPSIVRTFFKKNQKNSMNNNNNIIIDIIKQSLNGDHPITYGATKINEEGEKIPEEIILTHRLDWCIE